MSSPGRSHWHTLAAVSSLTHLSHAVLNESVGLAPWKEMKLTSSCSIGRLVNVCYSSHPCISFGVTFTAHLYVSYTAAPVLPAPPPLVPIIPRLCSCMQHQSLLMLAGYSVCSATNVNYTATGLCVHSDILQREVMSSARVQFLYIPAGSPIGCLFSCMMTAFFIWLRKTTFPDYWPVSDRVDPTRAGSYPEQFQHNSATE